MDEVPEDPNEWPDDAPLDVDETAAIIQELLESLSLLREVAPNTLLVAAEREDLGRDVAVLRVLTSLAEHLAEQDD